MADLDYHKFSFFNLIKLIVGEEVVRQRLVQEGLCTTWPWSRRERAPRGPGGGVHHVVQEGACTTWSRRGYAPRGRGP